MLGRRWFSLIALALLGVLFAGCDAEEEQEVLETVRAVKTITVTDLASGQMRRFPGTIEAGDSSFLSFEVSGNTREVLVEAGDRVRAGDVLATLDPSPFELDVGAAEASLSQARADLAEQANELDRQRTLYQKGWVAKAVYDQALAARDSADSQVAYAQSQLNLARRDLEKTQLIAPFDGIIATREIEPFQEVSRGERVLELFAEGTMQATVSIPETAISSIFLGQPATAIFAANQLPDVEGRVVEIGQVASESNAFTVKIALLDTPADVLPGMTVAVQILLEQEGEQKFLLPLSAILAGEERGHGYVFIFDPETSTVSRRQVTGGGVQDDQILIHDGVNAGDIVVIAGVSFLRDGQRVKLLEQ